MPDFGDIALEWDKIKKEPDALDGNRVIENKNKGTSADDESKRQRFLPSKEEHAKASERFSLMFDKSSRAGSKSNSGGLILPNGRKNFADFHDNFTGTGRVPKKPAGEGGFTPSDNAPQSEGNTPKVSVVLFERCIDCGQRVSQDQVVPDMDIVPPKDRFTDEIDKWGAVGLKPGMIICSLFCFDCSKSFMEEHRRILNDPFKNSFQVVGPDGSLMPAAALDAEKLKHEHRQRTRENMIIMIKRERANPLSECFYGEARLGN